MDFQSLPRNGEFAVWVSSLSTWLTTIPTGASRPLPAFGSSGLNDSRGIDQLGIVLRGEVLQLQHLRADVLPAVSGVLLGLRAVGRVVARLALRVVRIRVGLLDHQHQRHRLGHRDLLLGRGVFFTVLPKNDWAAASIPLVRRPNGTELR